MNRPIKNKCEEFLLVFHYENGAVKSPNRRDNRVVFRNSGCSLFAQVAKLLILNEVTMLLFVFMIHNDSGVFVIGPAKHIAHAIPVFSTRLVASLWQC